MEAVRRGDSAAKVKGKKNKRSREVASNLTTSSSLWTSPPFVRTSQSNRESRQQSSSLKTTLKTLSLQGSAVQMKQAVDVTNTKEGARRGMQKMTEMLLCNGYALQRSSSKPANEH